MKSMEKTEDNILAAKCSVIKHDSVIGNKGDGLNTYRLDINENDLDEKYCGLNSDTLQDCNSNRENMECNEKEEVQAMSPEFGLVKTNISPEEAEELLNACITVNQEKENMECNEKDEVQAMSQEFGLVKTNISPEEADDSEDNSGELLNACITVNQEKENMECNEKDEVQAMSQEFGIVKTNISSDEADDSEDSCAELLNAWKDYPELYWKSYFSGDEGGDNTDWNDEQEEVQAMSQVFAHVNTNISPEDADDSEDNSGELLNACITGNQEKENMECNEKDEVQAMSQEFGLVKTNISSDEADDSEDSCAELLNAWKDYPELYWKSYFSGDEGGDNTDWNDEQEEVQAMSQVFAHVNTNISPEDADDSEDNSGELLNACITGNQEKENMECNEKDEVQAMSQEFGLVKTNISSDEADDSEDSCAELLNAWKDYPELYWKSYFSGDEGGDNTDWNDEQEEVQAMSQVFAHVNTNISPEDADDSEDNSGELLNACITGNQEKENMKCNEKNEVQAMSQEFGLVKTNISSDEADDSEDSCAEFLNAWKDYPELYWKSYFSGDEGGDNTDWNDEQEEVQAMSQVFAHVNTNISPEEADDSEDNSGELLNACITVNQEKLISINDVKQLFLEAGFKQVQNNLDDSCMQVNDS
ncbi:uncharacterized protein LOC132925700 [Rhopalosiphum padi]|uniref:uncharacterized protein LOC132925700 n=1 Tax=Rhopalosiphum padi TaxID=40932 RepID=UPI00298DB800|nr:uncharacterized protein LOC132925700 [Rhopalosiphum padi]